MVSLRAAERSLENAWHAWLLAGEDGTRPAGDCVPSQYWGRREGSVQHIADGKTTVQRLVKGNYQHATS